MSVVLTLVCRAIHWIAVCIVPKSLSGDWAEEWGGDLWRWILSDTKSGNRESIRVLWNHTRRAFLASLAARFRTEAGNAEIQLQLGSPRLCLLLCAAPLVVVTAASFGLPNLRLLARGLPYPDPARIVVLAQGPPIFGVRIGFNDRELALFSDGSKTAESMASYVWRSVRLEVGGNSRDVRAAYVSHRFFDILGIGLHLDQADEFLASHSLWQSTLRGDPNVVGRTYSVAGRTMRLAGVLPREFTFLNAPIGIWMRMNDGLASLPGPWWIGLKGAIARLRTGVAPGQAEVELRELQVKATVGRNRFRIKATPIRDVVYSELRSYGASLLTVLGSIMAWAVGGFLRDIRGGMPARFVAKYWGFFALKPVLLLAGLFLFLFEFTSVNALGLTGGIQNRGGLFLTWWSFVIAAITVIWSWRDQPSRCRVCLHRMRQPLRIGSPGQVLLETSGQEILCPMGHGSVYTAESILGSEISNRWMGFEKDLFK